MARLANLVKVSTATAGTGTVTLGAAVAGWLTFAQGGVLDGDTVTYSIVEGNNREVGRGVYTASGTTLTRASILSSTNGGAAIVLAGAAEVIVTAAATDMIGAVPRHGALFVREWPLQENTNGTAAETGYDHSERGPGWVLSTGTTATGTAGVRLSRGTLDANAVARSLANDTLLGCWSYVPDLSTAAEEFTVEIGFHESWAYGGLGATGVYFLYDRATYGANWRAITRASSVSTVTDTGVAVVAASMQYLEIEYVNSGRVRFLVNGALVATHSTNIPDPATRIGVTLTLRKSAGVTARRAHMFGPTKRVGI